MRIMTAARYFARCALWPTLSVLLAWSPLVAGAQTPEQRGQTIAEEAERRSVGYHDFSARLQMVLRSRDGNEKIRVMRILGLETQDGGDRTMVIFDEPRDLRGTALLTVTHTDKSDEQWLYLPALKRVKRIASGKQTGSFMGSEFAYEDIGSQEVEKFTYRYIRDETLDGMSTFVVERYPTDASSGYSRQVVWLDVEEYRALRIDYYDRRDVLFKTLTIEGYRKHAGRFWRPAKMLMLNHQNGRSTTLIWSDYEFATGLREQDFTRASLGRLRV